MSAIHVIALTQSLAVFGQIGSRYVLFLICASYSPLPLCSMYAALKVTIAEKKSVVDAVGLMMQGLLVAVVATLWVMLHPETFIAAPHRVLLLLGFTIANLTVRSLLLLLLCCCCDSSLRCCCGGGAAAAAWV
jgi:hypothetical protein